MRGLKEPFESKGRQTGVCAAGKAILRHLPTVRIPEESCGKEGVNGVIIHSDYPPELHLPDEPGHKLTGYGQVRYFHFGPVDSRYEYECKIKDYDVQKLMAKLAKLKPARFQRESSTGSFHYETTRVLRLGKSTFHVFIGGVKGDGDTHDRLSVEFLPLPKGGERNRLTFAVTRPYEVKSEGYNPLDLGPWIARVSIGCRGITSWWDDKGRYREKGGPDVEMNFLHHWLHPTDSEGRHPPTDIAQTRQIIRFLLSKKLVRV